MAQIHPAQRSALWLLVIAAAAWGVHANSFGNAFVLDDLDIIENNPKIRSLLFVPELFASNYWGSSYSGGLYRPLVMTSFALNFAAGGLETGGYTAVNLAIHVGVCLLLFLLLRSFAVSAIAAGCASLLFAVHPAHTEAVVGFVGRAETLAAFFVLLTLLLHRNIPTHPSRRRALRILAPLALLLGLLSKENAATALGLLVAMDFLLPVRRRNGQTVTLRSRLRSDYGSYLVVICAYALLRTQALGSILPTVETLPLNNPLVRASSTSEIWLTPFAAIAEYARLIFWPARLSADYSLNQIPLVTSLVDPRLLLGAIAFAATLGGAFFLRRRAPVAAFGLSFLAISFSTTINLLVVIGTLCAERLLYLPSAGLALVAAAAWEGFAKPGPARRTVAIALLFLALGACANRTWARNTDWRDALSLWESSTLAAPNSAKNHHNLGNELRGVWLSFSEANQPEEAELAAERAEWHLRRALEIFPELPQAMTALATLIAKDGELDEALILYEKAAGLNDQLTPALNDWAIVLEKRADLMLSPAGQVGSRAEAREDALQLYRLAVEKHSRVIEIVPTAATSLYHRGRLYYRRLEDPWAAARDYREVLRLAPNHPRRASMLDVVSTYGEQD